MKQQRTRGQEKKENGYSSFAVAQSSMTGGGSVAPSRMTINKNSSLFSTEGGTPEGRESTFRYIRTQVKRGKAFHFREADVSDTKARVFPAYKGVCEKSETCRIADRCPIKWKEGSILVEAIVMIGLISALTPVLYKHVSDRRSEVEDINKANTFLLIQRETERYLKENRGNVASGLLPLSNIGLARLDSKYVIGIKRKDDGDVYAMIAEKEASNGGNDMKAGKVASLIGVSAGIYSAINSANAYGINGVWIEKLEDYRLGNIVPTGSTIVTTQYNQEKQKFYTSDIFADTDLDMGNHNFKAGNVTAGKLCIKGRCIDEWQELTLMDLDIVDGCNAGLNTYCQQGYERNINRTCAQIDAVYEKAGILPIDEYFSITYGTGTTYEGYKTVKCIGNNMEIRDINKSSFSGTVGLIGDSIFNTQREGWYQVILKGMAGSFADAPFAAAGGILMTNKKYPAGKILTIKGIRAFGNGGVGISLWEDDDTIPSLIAGGANNWGWGGGGFSGGWFNEERAVGCNWRGECSYTANPPPNRNCCTAYPCNYVAMGGCSGTSTGGTGYCINGYNCKSISGGNRGGNYNFTTYGNWVSSSTNGYGYASISYCGNSESDCPITCDSDNDCSATAPFCDFTEGTCVANLCPDIGEVVLAVEGADADPFLWAASSVTTPANVAYIPNYYRSYEYAIPCSGKYKFELNGGGYVTGGMNVAGGIAKGEKFYSAGGMFSVVVVAGATGTNNGVGIRENNSFVLMAGGGGWTWARGGYGGGGLAGGYAYYLVDDQNLARYGYGVSSNLNSIISRGSYRTLSSSSVGTAQGGGVYVNAQYYAYGGSGTSIANCIAAGFTGCSVIAGGNIPGYDNGINYPSSLYGNLGEASATVTYCGSDTNSVCP